MICERISTVDTASTVPTAGTVTGTAFCAARAVTTGTGPAAPRPAPRPPLPAEAPGPLRGEEQEASSAGRATKKDGTQAVCGHGRHDLGFSTTATTATKNAYRHPDSTRRLTGTASAATCPA